MRNLSSAVNNSPASEHSPGCKRSPAWGEDHGRQPLRHQPPARGRVIASCPVGVELRMQMTAENPFFFAKERAGGASCLSLAGDGETILLQLVASDGTPGSNAAVSLSYSKHTPADLRAPLGNCRPLIIHRHAWGVFKQVSMEKLWGSGKGAPSPSPAHSLPLRCLPLGPSGVLGHLQGSHGGSQLK